MLEKYDAEVPVSYIGELVMNELKSVDQVAYVRFASVYREFKDINEFMDELKSMLSGSALAAAVARQTGKKAAKRKKAPARKGAGGSSKSESSR